MPTDLPEPPDRLPETPEQGTDNSPSRHEKRTGYSLDTQSGGPRGGRPAADGGSFVLAVISGIPLRVHWSFFILLVLIGLGSLSGASDPGSSGRVVLVNIVYVLGLFVCVVLHEFGHALTARRYGIQTRDVVLYPIGGVASLEKMPRPRQELWIALAGPAVNVVIAAILYAAARARGLPVASVAAAGGASGLLVRLMWTNVMLVVFNMIPAFPMDGGRVLRALLARTMSENAATQLAASIGRFIAVAMGIYGFFAGWWMLTIVAVFVYMAASQEAAAFQAKSFIAGHRVKEAMLREFRTLPVGTTLREAADALLAGSQQDFPVVNGDEVVGVLSRGTLMRGFASEGPDAYVAGVMEREFQRVSPDDDLETVLTEASRLNEGPLLVMEGDSTDASRLLGMITQQNLLEFLALAQLWERVPGPRR